MSPNRIILHLDLDYFFAQVEELRHPDSKGKPIVVCIYSGRTQDSGAVSTCNYVARKFGVKSGMPIIRAKKILEGKDATFLRADHAYYANFSEQIMQILLKQVSISKFEQTSIDEAYLDLSEKSKGDYFKAKDLAQRIKKEILEKIKLTCSVGIGPNKLIAKIASAQAKPNGLTMVKPNEVETFLSYMEADAIPGVGDKTKEALEGMSVRTISDLRSIDPVILVEKFGKKTGVFLYQASRGIDESIVQMSSEQKQISRIATLKEDTRDINEIMELVNALAEDIAEELKANNLTFETVGINAIDSTIAMHTKSKTIMRASSDVEEIKKVAKELYTELLSITTVNFRRAGVRVEKLESKKGQKTLGEF
ncbi:MAG: DNA polymerase IV [Candidatus Micrarchaeota archaeon]